MGSRKSRILLKLLAVERPGLVPVDRIVEVLWDDEPPAAAEQNVATLVSRLRGALGSGRHPGRPARLPAGRPAPAVSVDLDAAARYCEQAERKLAASPASPWPPPNRPSCCCRRAPRWPTSRTRPGRTRPAASCASSCAGLASSRPRRRWRPDDARTAARHAEAAMTADPFDEAAHRCYMSACAAAGEPARALAAYAALRERLAEELGADPAPADAGAAPGHPARAAVPGTRLCRASAASAAPSTHQTRAAAATSGRAVGRSSPALHEAWARAVGRRMGAWS